MPVQSNTNGKNPTKQPSTKTNELARKPEKVDKPGGVSAQVTYDTSNKSRAERIASIEVQGRADITKVERFTIEQRRALVSELYAQYVPQQEIAKILGISQTTVSLDISAIKKELREWRGDNVEERIGEEFYRLKLIEQKALESYALSTQVYKMVEGKMQVVGMRPGNVSYLEEMRKCVETRLKVLGALKGTTVNVNNNVSLFDLICGAVGIPPEAFRGQEEGTRTIESKDTPPLQLEQGKRESNVERRLREEREKTERALEEKRREAEEECYDGYDDSEEDE